MAKKKKKKFWEMDRKEKIFLILFSIYVLITAIIILKLYASFPKIKEAVENKLTASYEIYPDTESAPTLTLSWGEKRENIFDVDTISGTIPFGSWSGGDPKISASAEPQTALELVLKTNRNPIYALEKGTVVYVNKNENTKESQIVLRYGKKYAVKYYRVLEMPSYITEGDKAEKGDLLGYTPTSSDKSDVYKIEVDKLISDRAARAIYPLEFFDETSKNLLLKIEQDEKLKLKASAENGDQSWIFYVGKEEVWASVARMGYKKEGLESAGDFSRANGLGWIINEEWKN